MERRVSSEELNELLANSSWVRNLALRLLADNDQAEDVVQEVWLTALRQPPRQPQALRAWLKKVASNLARKNNRTEARRRVREEQRPPTPPIVPPDVLVERLELQGRVANAVVALPEPYRAVIYLRFYVGLANTDIARDLERPESTVRTQVARGLELLRADLDEGLRDRDGGWRGALALVFLPELKHLVDASSTASAATRATTSMAATTKRIGRLVLPLCVVFLLLSLTGDDAGPGDSVRETATRSVEVAQQTAPADAAVRDQTTSSIANGNDERAQSTATATSPGVSAAVAGGKAASPEAAAPVVAAPATASLHPVLVVGADGVAVAEATIELFVTGNVDAVARATTNSAGRVFVPRADLARSALRVVAAGFVEYREPSILRTLDDDTPYVIELAATFSGLIRVLHPSGAGAAGVTIELRANRRVQPQPDAEYVTTDRHGEATFWFRQQDTEVHLSVPGYATVAVPALRSTTEIMLQPGRPVTGRIVTADGSPLRDCTIIVTTTRTRTSGSVVRSGLDGTFDMGSLEENMPVVMSVYPPDLPPFKTSGTPPRTGVWQIPVPASQHLEGRLLVSANSDIGVDAAVVFLTTPQSSAQSPRGNNIPSLRSEIVGSRYQRARTRLVPLRRTRPDEAGWFGIDYVAGSDETSYLLVHHPQLVNRVIQIDPEQPLAPITLEVGSEVCGRVVAADGSPLAGVVLHLGEKWSNDMESVLGRARTDENGEFCFGGVPQWAAQPLSSNGTTDIYRSEIFVTAFAPDLLLSGNGVAIADSTVPDSFVVTPRHGKYEELELVATDRGQVLDLGLAIADSEGTPITTWVPAIIMTDTEFCHGVVGPRGQGYVFAGERTLALEHATTLDLVLMPPGSQWLQVALRPTNANSSRNEYGNISIRIAPQAAATSLPTAALGKRGAPLFLALPLDSTGPKAPSQTRALVAIGIIATAPVMLPPLPDGDYFLWSGDVSLPATRLRASAPTPQMRPLGGFAQIRNGVATWRSTIGEDAR
ncbi:MAG: sigma-70 family RNA polymerase sigma factor [Planctomycetota bacterium]